MILPMPVVENFELDLISRNSKIKVRPFLVSEEKIIMMGAENDNKTLMESMIQIVSNCIQEEKFDVTKMSIVDFVWVIINLRKASKGNMIDLTLSCTSEKCFPEGSDHSSSVNDGTYDIDEVVFFGDTKLKDFEPNKKYWIDRIVKITDDIAVELNPTSVKYIKQVLDGKEHENEISVNKAAYNLIKSHIIAVLGGEERHENIPDEDLEKFLDRLTLTQFETLRDFFNKEVWPRIKISWVCETCKEQISVTKDNILDFLV